MSVFAKLFSSIPYLFYNWKYSKYDFFHYKDLTRTYYDVPQIGFMRMNMLYGNHKCAKKAMGRSLNHFTELMEHAVFFDNNLPDTRIKKTKKVITTSQYRKRLIENHFLKNEFRGEVFSIGAYIKYANHFLSEEQLSRIKAKYGKILLVMPSHSIDGVDVQYEKSAFQKEIDRIAADYDTVFICLYWKDVQNGDAVFYEQKGYVVVCNGMRSDPNFMSRQRDLLELADLCMSNALGSYVGYSIVMGKPFYFYPQELEVTTDKENQAHLNQFKRENALINEFTNVFGHYSTAITEQQRALIDKYWGL